MQGWLCRYRRLTELLSWLSRNESFGKRASLVLGERCILIRISPTLANRLKDIRKSNSFDQLHCVVLQAVIFTDPIDRDNVRVVQTRCGFRLPFEPLPMLLFGRCGFVDHLQRHMPL